MQLTIEVPDELKSRLQELRDRLPEMVERVILEMSAGTPTDFEDENEVLEQLAGNPTPEEVLALRPSPRLQARVSQLLERRKTEALTADEEVELERFLRLEHLVRLAKAQALKRSTLPR